MKFIKVGAVWNSAKKDKHGQPFMSGVISEDREIHKGEKVFVFKVNPAYKKPTSPVANIVIGVDGEQYQPPAPEPEPLPDPLPDDSEPPF